MKKRLLSALLVLCMVFSLMPVTALAEGETPSAKGGDATFTLRADSSSCAEGHTGELGSLQVTGVDISQWEADKKITIQYEVQYRCTDSSCALYDSDDSFFSYSGTHTFTDINGEFCHKKISESFSVTIPTGTKNFSISFTLTSDKGIYESVLHEQNVNLCTEYYYNPRCWECKGCGYFFLHADMSGEKFTTEQVYFPPVGHKMNHFDAKDPTCIAKGTVEYWQCERCQRNFGDENGEKELTTIETPAPLAKHTYNTNGICSVCDKKAAAGIWAGGTTWYDTMANALAALDSMSGNAELTINDDYNDTITLSKTCTVKVKAGVTVSSLKVTDTEGCKVTVINDGTISALTGYTGKLVLKSGSGTYGSITNSSEGGTVGALLHRDSAAKFCCYKKGSTWLHPDAATDSTIENVTVAYAPLATLAITGDSVTGSDGSYALTADKDDTITLTAAAKDMDGKDASGVSYGWYYEKTPNETLGSEAKLELTNIKAGKRTIVCKATADGYSITAELVLTVEGQKDAQSFTVKLSQDTCGVREKVLPLLSVAGVQEEAAVTYYLMTSKEPAPETDTKIDADFTFEKIDNTTGERKIYAYAAETDNFAVTTSDPVTITVTPHYNHCSCGGTLNHTHENVEWQAWDGESEIEYNGKWIPISDTGSLWYKVAYVYLTGDVSANLTISGRTILHLCLNGYNFTSADPSKPAITVAGTEKAYVAKLDLCDCGSTGTLGGSTVSGGSVHATWAEVNLYGGTLTGNNTTGNGGAVYLTNSSFTMHGGAITNNTATNGGGIYAGSDGNTVTINGGVISGNSATNGGGIYAANGAQFHLSGGEINGNTATEEGGGVYCSHLYSQNTGRCEFYGGTISGNTAQRGGGAYVDICYIGYRNCRITGNTATEAGGGLYLRPSATANRIYMGNVYGSGGTIAPYIYDNTVNSAQNNLYLSDPDTQIQFSSHIDTNADIKLGVYFTGITGNGASVLLSPLQINSEARAKPYLDRIVCDNPDYGQLKIEKDDEYYNLHLLNTTPMVTVTFDPNGGTLNAGEESKTIQFNDPYGTLPTPTRASYRFDGWFTEQDGGTKVEADTTVSIRGNHTLYAHWTFQHEHCICGGDTAAGDHTAHTPQVFTAWNGTDAIAYTNRIAYVYLTQNVTFSSNLVVDGTTLYLCLSGNTFASNGTNKIQVSNGGRLVLCDCAGGGTIKGATKGWGGSCIYLYQSRLDIFGGKITGGKVTTNGGGGAIALDDSKCVLNIYGGEISGNNGKNSGGAIFLNNKDGKGGTVNMYGGTIANNSAKNGGVIYSECGGTINLVGGTISGNKATSGDGGVINMAGGTITLSGAKLTGNSASRYGGAVYLYNGVTATMTGGEISNNKAGSEGGAVHVYGTSTFNLSGGTITGNSSKDGGAIYLNREPSVLTMTGGVISGNTATGNGGGVYIYRTGSVCNLSGGRIENNTAGGSGGGIYVNYKFNGQLKISGAPVVQDNTVSGAVNNVYLPSGKVLTISGGMEDGASIGVTTANKNYPVAFSNAYDTDYSGFFRADDAGAEVVYKTDKMLYLGARQYEITILDTENGKATANLQRAAAGTRITLTPAPSVGYHFMDWTVIDGDITITKDASGKDGFTMPASNVTIQAVFAQHSFTAETVDGKYLKTAADCENDAVYYKSCACGEKGTDTFTKVNSALGHAYGPWTSNDNGTHTRTCSRDASHTETKDCHGGTASCIAKAVCDDCKAAYGEMIAHIFTAETAEETYLKSEATCTDKAVYYKSCAVCDLSSKGTAGEATFESGKPLDHAYGPWTSNGNGTHTHICSRDTSHTETKDCHGGTATCIAEAVCEDCKTAYGAKDPQKHADGCEPEWITTEEKHEQKYSKCGQEVVPEEDHEWENGTCTECSYVCQHSGGKATCTEKAVCEICGESYSDPLGHDWGQWTVTTPATARTEGVETRTCRNDASHTETRAIPKLAPERGHTSRRFPAGGTTNSTGGTGSATGTDKTVKSSDTGDMGVALYAATALLSVTGMAWVGRKKRGN